MKFNFTAIRFWVKSTMIGVICLIFLLPTGCGFGKAETVIEQPVPILRVGAVPSEKKAKTQDELAKFMDYLGRKTGRTVELYVADDYNGIIDKMAKNQLDIAWFGPFSYVIAAEAAGAKAFATDDNIRGGTVYHSVFIVHPDSEIDSLEKVKGHTFAFTDETSTSGYLIPKAILRKKGIDADKDFPEVLFEGSHDASVLAVKKRQVDVAAVSDTILHSLREKGIIGDRDIRLIYTSDDIPTSVWAYRQGIDAELLVRIQQAFFDVAQEDKAALGIYGKDLVKGFVPTDDAKYNIIRETARELGIKRPQ
ncbi:MAG: phosphate/phosphite/phosphonate ABC transporter substrate-binding protein [Negativicutes bacterium]|nr:phosphate/phosphite/phosphonate ABC transporter substrate-binding protein [Negativicutes bacterium]